MFLSLRAGVVPYSPAIHMEAQYSNLDRRLFPENVPNVLEPRRVSAATECQPGGVVFKLGVKRIAQSYCRRPAELLKNIGLFYQNCPQDLTARTQISIGPPSKLCEKKRVSGTKSTNGRKNPVTKRVRMRHRRPVRLPCAEEKK